MGYFEIFRGKNADFYFRLKAGNHEPILQSEGYTTLAACENGVSSVKKNAPDDDRYTRRDGNSFSFVLKAANGQTIGQSEGYTTASSRDNGIEAVQRNAPTAEVKDKTAV
ncbi:YegP family protein [Hymenobacter sp.]|jgi:hypothetical protein|uniref:YegP family protein n=1 Tax=Hymenobacter sp. TaxID=1898978 RepID=UPI002EDA5EDA